MGNTLAPIVCPGGSWSGINVAALHNASVFGIDVSIGTPMSVTATDATIPVSVASIGYFGGVNISLEYKTTAGNTWAEVSSGATDVLSTDTFPVAVGFDEVPYADDGTSYDYRVVVRTGTDATLGSMRVPGGTVAYSETVSASTYVADVDFGGSYATYPVTVNTLADAAYNNTTTVYSLVDNDNDAIAATIQITDAFDSANTAGTSTSSDSGALYDSQLMDSYILSSGTSTAAINFVPGEVGTFVIRCSGSRNLSGTRECDVTIDGVTDTFNASSVSGGNTIDYSEHTLVVTDPEAEYTISFGVAAGSTTTYIGGMRISKTA